MDPWTALVLRGCQEGHALYNEGIQKIAKVETALKYHPDNRKLISVLAQLDASHSFVTEGYRVFLQDMQDIAIRN